MAVLLSIFDEVQVRGALVILILLFTIPIVLKAVDVTKKFIRKVQAMQDEEGEDEEES
jgi:hypothetical protein